MCSIDHCIYCISYHRLQIAQRFRDQALNMFIDLNQQKKEKKIANRAGNEKCTSAHKPRDTHFKWRIQISSFVEENLYN